VVRILLGAVVSDMQPMRLGSVRAHFDWWGVQSRQGPTEDARHTTPGTPYIGLAMTGAFQGVAVQQHTDDNGLGEH
jgi:hypothetical protein